MAAMCDVLLIVVEYVEIRGRRVLREARSGDNMGIESRIIKVSDYELI